MRLFCRPTRTIDSRGERAEEEEKKVVLLLVHCPKQVLLRLQNLLLLLLLEKSLTKNRIVFLVCVPLVRIKVKWRRAIRQLLANSD